MRQALSLISEPDQLALHIPDGTALPWHSEQSATPEKMASLPLSPLNELYFIIHLYLQVLTSTNHRRRPIPTQRFSDKYEQHSPSVTV